MTTLTPRQRQILMGLAAGDLLWEVPGKSYVCQYDERTKRDLRVSVEVLKSLEESGLVRRVSADQKLDHWEITAAGKHDLS